MKKSEEQETDKGREIGDDGKESEQDRNPIYELEGQSGSLPPVGFRWVV